MIGGMKCLIASVASFAWYLMPAAFAQISPYMSVNTEAVTICPASETDVAPPGPETAGCTQMPAWDVDPQNQHIWAYFALHIPERANTGDAPLGLGVSAKASSLVFLNGQELGANGMPGDTRASEIPGKMDIVYPIPPDLLKTRANTVSIRMSSHAGFLTLANPLHGIYVAPFATPQDVSLRRYWPSMVPFGAFALAALYFLVMALRGRQRIQAALLGGMATLAAVQLFAEISRGLFAYTYPLHDIRLIAILVCAALFGLCLAAYVVEIFAKNYRWRFFTGAAFVTFLGVIIPDGLDGKAAIGLLAPTFFAAVVAFYFYWKSQPQAGVFGVALLGFAAINLFGAGQFLDLYFYYAVAALMLFLFVQQASAYVLEQALHTSEAARADRLQYILDEQSDEANNINITLISVGRMTQIPVSQIAHIHGAGDYSEIILVEGSTHLHTDTLSELEASLPSYFLRVHRSHIVNTKLIECLDRDPSGTGKLLLTTGHAVPVSRRIMPSIRKALT